MSLPQIFQWVVSAHLDDHKSAELVLLKGHLLLEVAIDNAAKQFLEKETRVRRNASRFRRMVASDWRIAYRHPPYGPELFTKAPVRSDSN